MLLFGLLFFLRNFIQFYGWYQSSPGSFAVVNGGDSAFGATSCDEIGNSIMQGSFGLGGLKIIGWGDGGLTSCFNGLSFCDLIDNN